MRMESSRYCYEIAFESCTYDLDHSFNIDMGSSVADTRLRYSFNNLRLRIRGSGLRPVFVFVAFLLVVSKG